MSTDARENALAESVAWLEEQVARQREGQTALVHLIEQLQRQVRQLAEDVDNAEREVRQIDPKLAPYKGVPDKINALAEDTEHIRQTITANRLEIDAALRVLGTEAEVDRHERAEAIKRIDRAVQQIELVTADVAQAQSRVAQVSETLTTVLERQREVEAAVEQFGLRLERAIEVNRDLEERVRQVLLAEQEERFDVVFERLQVVGEMVKRNEQLIREVTAEQTLREEVLQEIGVWRDEHTRIEGRLASLEETADRVLGHMDRLQGEITLLEGRHSGLGERVAGLRRDITEVVDQVRDEFIKFNKMFEKQRRKQIEVLQQELRETKFHAFRPPEEP
ncbi:MAG: hypothetical protein Kow0010_14010 [Dehalococcoidia bacterium]